jgi:hypothetical protein
VLETMIIIVAPILQGGQRGTADRRGLSAADRRSRAAG